MQSLFLRMKHVLFEAGSSKRYKLSCAHSDQSLMVALWVAKGPMFLQASDQTVRMYRLILNFAIFLYIHVSLYLAHLVSS